MHEKGFARAARIGVIAIVLAAGLGGQASASHQADAEDNDSCAQANGITTGSVHSGYIDGYPGDYQDFYGHWVNAGDTIHVSMYPSYASGSADFNLVLYYPSCVIAAFDYQPDTTSEHVSFTATSSGTWYSEVWGQFGSGYYGIYWSISNNDPPPCDPTMADAASVVTLTTPDGRTFYIEERGNPLGTPVPGSGLLLGDGTWVYEEVNGLVGLQRGGVNILGESDPVNDENCGYGPDQLLF